MATKFTHITLKEDKELIITNKEELCSQLRALGLQKGMVVLVQANMKKMGYLIGGEQMLIEALMDTVGYEGTIVIPTFTLDLLDPACQKKQLPRIYWEEVRKNSLPFDKKTSAPIKEDTLACQFLRNEGVARSNHPIYSFAAWGKYAKLICDYQPLHFGLNQESPLGEITKLNGYVALLGCDYDECIMYKLACYKAKELPIKVVSAPILRANHMQWKKILDLDFERLVMPDIGPALEERNIVKNADIASAPSHFFSSREAVQLAAAYQRVQKEETNTSQN